MEVIGLLKKYVYDNEKSTEDAIQNYDKKYILLNADYFNNSTVDKILNKYFFDIDIISALLNKTNNKEEIIRKILQNKNNEVFMFIFTYMITLDEKYVILTIKEKNVELLDFLLASGIKATKIADYAILLKEYSFIRSLIFKGLDITVYKTGILYLAAANGDLEIVKKMIDCEYSHTLLLISAIDGQNFELIKYLIESNIKISLVSLYHSFHYPNIFNYLIEHSPYYEEIVEFALKNKKYEVANKMLNKIDRIEYFKKHIENKRIEVVENLATDEEKKLLF